MFERYLSKSIHEDESVIRLLRPSWIHYRRSLAGFVFCAIVSLFFWYPLHTLGRIGWVLFAAMIAFCVFGLVRLFVIRSFTAFIITNRRIIDIDQRKLFERHVSECPLENIRDIRYNKSGFLHMACNVGTVIIEAGGGTGHLECQDVHNPEDVKDLISRVQHHNKNSL